MNIKQILKLLPTELFTKLSKKYNTDYKAKKLHGETIFKVLLFSMFSEKNYTLQKLQKNFIDPTFQKKYLKREDYDNIDRTAFHYRLNNINPNFFKEIYEKTLKKFKDIPLLKKDKSYNLFIFDSTLVNLSSKLLRDIGFSLGGNNTSKSKIKYTIGLTEFPEVLQVQSHYDENKSLETAILSTKIPKESIILFDRGLTKRATMDEISKKNYFITRLNRNYIIKEETNKPLSSETETLYLNKEITGKLYRENGEETSTTYRIIHATAKHKNWDEKKRKLLYKRHKSEKEKSKSLSRLKEEINKEEILFLTNIPSEYLSSEEITDLYRNRWRIELFFKFIKQELHFSHLINRTENGIRVMLYITMLFALILMYYKEKNKLQGYKYVKYKMLQELQEEFYEYVVEISGGSKQKWRNAIGNPFF